MRRHRLFLVRTVEAEIAAEIAEDLAAMGVDLGADSQAEAVLVVHREDLVVHREDLVELRVVLAAGLQAVLTAVVIGAADLDR